ncbi:TlpA family protein disulfide reductase [Candidatus Bathyarchaeota archaeon]|nr:TlpA family protein disulfide reductase [Candidatus Bathyarchaeota archaeon]
MRIMTLALIILCLTALPVQSCRSSTQAEDFRLKDIYGREFGLTDFRGKVVLLEFFATWCSPCKPQMAELKEIRSRYSQEQLVIVSVSFDPSMDTDDVLRSLASNFSAEWTIARDTVGISNKYGVNIGPTIFLIDRSGAIRYTHPGLTSSERLTPEIDQLLYEAAQPSVPKPSGHSDLTPLFLFFGSAILVMGTAVLVRRRRSSRKRYRSQR